MSRLPGAAPSRPAHLKRRRQIAPWAQPSTGERARPVGRHSAPPPPLPVFVDESGRRRRVGQTLGVSVGTLVLGYVVVVALTFGGVPMVGWFAPPGLGDLARPAGEDGPGVGSGAQVSPLPTVGAPGSASAAGGAATPAQAPAADDDTVGGRESVATTPTTTPPTTAPPPPTTAPPPPTTTTTVSRGQGTTTSVPAPGSTVPEPPRGRPTEPPGGS
jgi:hypothetical protein